MANILVDSDKNLINLLSKIEEHTEIGLDTEFIRESTYRPILALMQIALPNNEIYIIDPVKITKKNIINKFLMNPKIIKIIHSSKQDLEALYSYTQVFPVNIFDTQIAAMVCGFGDQVAYETLVNQIVDKRIDKSSRFTDRTNV